MGNWALQEAWEGKQGRSSSSFYAFFSIHEPLSICRTVGKRGGKGKKRNHSRGKEKGRNKREVELQLTAVSEGGGDLAFSTITYFRGNSFESCATQGFLS